MSNLADFQNRAAAWLDECFGPEWEQDRSERLHRFVEEAIELAQAAGSSREEIHQLIDYVFQRPSGDLEKEVGGVLVTLAGFSRAYSIDLQRAGDEELDHNYKRIETIRQKRLKRRLNTPLP